MPIAARDRLRDRFGPTASAGSDDFGGLVGELCQKWGLDAHTVRAGGTGAVVECVSSADGTRYALKLSPDRAITAQESAALTYAKRVEFVFELWDRRRRALKDSPIETAVWRRCHAAAMDAASSGDSLTHGDLHPGNILRVGDGRRMVAIDPRPCIGDPATDLADLAMTGATSVAAIRTRCSQLADIADPIDADRLWHWCCNFAPLVAVSLARRAARTEDIILMRNLADAG